MTGTDPTPPEHGDAMDCGDNSCRYAPRPRTGMRTNGGCRCHYDRPALEVAQKAVRLAHSARQMDGQAGALERFEAEVKVASMVEKFVAAAVLAERERCAKLCEDRETHWDRAGASERALAAEALADAIRGAP